jgi:hypothetical protein
MRLILIRDDDNTVLDTLTVPNSTDTTITVKKNGQLVRE